ncbi:protein MTSS 2-like [Pollicipes pollicipes]|uniref:protein MTSS 2-like n=1 Tax=Pollicipes pollicipes TaxID=41117 RepID=UPI0018850E21|nr:protein MTSS 2-like [Pollicipes pollicipes]
MPDVKSTLRAIGSWEYSIASISPIANSLLVNVPPSSTSPIADSLLVNVPPSSTSPIANSLVLPLFLIGAKDRKPPKCDVGTERLSHCSRPSVPEYRRSRTELKKRSSEAQKQHKKARKVKSPDAQRSLTLQLSDVQDRYQRLEAGERASLEAALVEERSRYCRFVTWLKPVVQGEVDAAEEMSRLTEVMEQLVAHTVEPFALPAASEQLIADIKGAGDAWQPGSPPDSPRAASSSLGSRKSSLCSINSLHSSSSGGTAPPAGGRPRSVSSHDSGFTSQDTLFRA